MKKIYTMTNLVKGLMLAALMTVGTAVNAQEGGSSAAGNTEGGAESTSYAPAKSNNYWRGENVETTSTAYIYSVGAQTFITNNTPAEKDIEKASVWTISKKNNTYAFVSKKDSVISMNGTYWLFSYSWSTQVKQGSVNDATYFTIKSSKTNGISYKFEVTCAGTKWSSDTRYFNIDGNEYTAAKTQGTYNDWLFISADQKAAYADYTSLYNQAIELYGNEKLADREDVKETLKSALKNTAASNYDKYTDDAATLKNAIDAANKAIEDITNGINNINDSAANGSAINTNAAAIYSINGVRNAQLTKGINIVKMSDGKVKKVLVK